MFLGKEQIKSLAAKRLWIFPTTLSILLFVLSQYNPVGFHTLAELATIIISFVVFALGWSTYRSSQNSLLIFLACGYFWVGALDLMHTFVFPGINIFVEGNANLSVQFWIVARYFEASLFLAAPLIMSRNQNQYILLIGFGIVSLLLTAAILLGSFPTVFVAGQGLTEFKIYSEYIIVIMLAIAVVNISRQDGELEAEEIALVIVAVLFTVLAELAFTLYDSLQAISFGLAGHLLKIYSFWFIFQAIIITNLRKPYAEIKQAEEKLSLHFRNTPLGCISWDTNFICTEWNKSAEKIFGYSADEAIGKHPNETILISETRDDLDDLFNLLLQQKGGNRNTNKNITKDGREIICNWYNTPITNEAGEVSGVASLLQDITEQREIEEALQRSQKMDAVGQLTGGLAHDFNNILGIIQGNFEILQRMLKDNDKAKTRIEAGLKGVARGAALTRKLLDFSRKETGSIQRISINNFIRDMEDLIVKSLTVSISVELHLDEDAWLVDIDPGDLQDVIINLALNARDAMPDGGNLVVESRNKVLDKKYAERTQGSKAGDFVMLSVSDTGHGMTAEVKEHVLEPFFTTKEQGKGTGLGLSMVYGFVQRSGGHIEIYSEPDKGTTFHLYLPRAEKKLIGNQIAEGTETDNLPTGTGTILVVDDEEDLRDIAVLYLESLGYQARTAENSEKALEFLSDNHDIDLLFSDIVMPGEKDGYQLAATAHQLYPELKVLLTSGFTRKRSKLHSVGDKYLIDLNGRILDKPYNLSELAFAIQATFNAQN